MTNTGTVQECTQEEVLRRAECETQELPAVRPTVARRYEVVIGNAIGGVVFCRLPRATFAEALVDYLKARREHSDLSVELHRPDGIDYDNADGLGRDLREVVEMAAAEDDEARS